MERREVPPSSQFLLVRTHVAAQAVLELAAVNDIVFLELGRAAAAVPVPPVSVILFGSFTRGEAGRDRGLDVVFVRPADLDEDDDQWAGGIERWRTDVQLITGNPVEVLEVAEDVVASRLTSDRPLWRDIRRDGRVVHGAGIDELLAGRRIAATSLAIHAAINAADVVCGARLGRRAVGDDHTQVLMLLRQAGQDGAAIETDLRRMLPLKTRACPTAT